MSANPLKRQFDLRGPSDEGQLLGICADYNRRCRKLGWQRWYFVEPANDAKPSEIRVVEGIKAEEVWTVLDGRRVEYWNWPQRKLEAIERRARWLIKQGGVQ